MNPEVYFEMAAMQRSHWWFSGRRDILASVLRTLSLAKTAEILDAGCGTGANLQLLARFGNVTAIEPDETARSLALREMDCPILEGTLPARLPFPRESFDLVCLLDVLEHIEDDAEALRSVFEVLKPGGIVLVTAPAYSWLWSAHDEAHRHYRRYTKTSLRRSLDQAGLETERSGYFNTLLFPAIALIRLMGKLAQREPLSDAVLPPTWLNALLHQCFALERRILPGQFMPFGVSVIAIAHRPLTAVANSFPGR